jgi:hypothetical protein
LSCKGHTWSLTLLIFSWVFVAVTFGPIWENTFGNLHTHTFWVKRETNYPEAAIPLLDACGLAFSLKAPALLPGYIAG